MWMQSIKEALTPKLKMKAYTCKLHMTILASLRYLQLFNPKKHLNQRCLKTSMLQKYLEALFVWT